MHNKKKKIITIIILLFVFSLLPVTIHYKDGGTVEYRVFYIRLFNCRA